HRGGVDVVCGTAHFLAVERPVPGSDRMPGERLQVGLLGEGVTCGRGCQPTQHFGDSLWGARRLIRCHPGSVTAVAEEGGTFSPQPGDLEHQLPVVMVASADTSRA